MTQLFGNMQTTCPVSCVLHTAFVHPVHHTAPNNLTKLNAFPLKPSYLYSKVNVCNYTESKGGLLCQLCLNASRAFAMLAAISFVYVNAKLHFPCCLVPWRGVVFWARWVNNYLKEKWRKRIWKLVKTGTYLAL